MKKLITILTFMIILTGCNGKFRTYDEINYDQYLKLVEEKQDFILYIGSTNCSHCQEFAPTLKKVIKQHQLDIKYIDISKLNTKQYAILQNKTKVQGTPTIVFFHKGIVDSGSDNKIQGSVSKAEIDKVLKKKGYIE